MCVNQIFKAFILLILMIGGQFSVAHACGQHDVAASSSVDCGHASSVRSSVTGAIHSVAEADLALVEAAENRLRVAAQFAKDERACYEKFFVTSCLDRAKEQRRNMLSTIRSVEIEANAFKRRARVEERDKKLENQVAE